MRRCFGGLRPDNPYVCAVYVGDLSVDCGGLTPGKTYRIGPTVTPLPSRNNSQKVEYYSFAASDDGSAGTARTPVRVFFYVVWYVDELSQVPVSRDGYGFSVARKVGKAWTDSLTGFLPNTP